MISTPPHPSAHNLTQLIIGDGADDIPAAEYWDTLASEAADCDSAIDAEEIVDLVGDEVATPRLRRSTRTAQGRQGRPFYGDPGSGDISAQRTPVSGAAAAATPTRSQRPRVPAGSGVVSGENLRKFTETRARPPRARDALILPRPKIQY